jgi:hypothetical protein
VHRPIPGRWGECPTLRIAGRYRVEAELARGGMGTVYAVFDESTGQRVALKRLGSRGGPGSTRRKGMPREPDAALLFQLEYTMLARLVHPSLIAVYDYGVDEGGPYYTMELLDGRDLRELSPVPYREACRLVRDVASSLALVHAHRLVHRDVSPRNVRVTRDGRAKLLDFGTLTPFGVPPDIAGTPPCVPPEALNGGALDNRADLYSLGSVLYRLLTGRDAFPARQLDDLPAFLEGIPAPPSAWAKGVPEALDALVLTMLSRDPLARPSSAAEVIERLDGIARLPPEERHEVAQAYFLSAKTVGRGAELELASACIERALDSGGGGLLVQGERGFGKTRLTRDIAVRAQTRGATVVVVEGSSGHGPNATARALGARLLQASPLDAVAAAAPYAAHLCHVVPELVGRLGEVEPSRPPEAPGEWRMRLQAAMKAWLLDFAARRPLVLVVDDIDRADESSAGLLASLARAARGTRLLVVVAADARVPLSTAQAYVTRLELRALGPKDIGTLVGSLFGEAHNAQRLSRWLLEVSRGRPRGVMDLLRHLVATKVVRYADGAWMLPEDLPADGLPKSVEEAVAARLARLRPETLTLAESLSVGRALPIGLCVALSDANGSVAPMAMLDELVTEGVLVGSGGRYGFAEESVRESLLGRMNDERRRRLHLEVGEALVRARSASTFDSITAGHHLLQGGSEERGAALLADSGRRLLAETDDLHAAVPALEAALAVFRKCGRPAHEVAALVGPLATAAFFVDRRLATEYGEDALALLCRATGLTRAVELESTLGKRAALGVGVATATMERLDRTGDRSPATTRELFELLFRASMSLAGVASVCLDAPAIERVLEALEPLSVLGADHGAVWVRTYCEHLRRMCLGELGSARAGLLETLEALEGGAHPDSFPERARRLFVGGALYALSAIESLRDCPEVLEYAERLEALDLGIYDMVADQLRMVYHAHRGESDLVRLFRDRVEGHAMQRGSAWQVEVWEAPVMLLVHMRENDVIGLKRTAKRLERISREVPSLEPFATLARAALFRLRGRLDEAAMLLEGLLAPSHRPFVGRSPAVGLLADVYNALGAHAHAERITGELLESLPIVERPFVALLLQVQIQHAHSLAGLGDLAGANRELDAALTEHGGGQCPVTLGLLHQARARVALKALDEAGFESHRAAMDRWLRPTRNPHLVAACEQLHHESRRGNGLVRRAGWAVRPLEAVSTSRRSVDG